MDSKENIPFNDAPSSLLNERIAADLQKQITSGALLPGEALPSVSALAKQYGTGRNVVLGALLLLKKAGYVEILRRKGSFVKKSSDNLPAISDSLSTAPYSFRHFIRPESPLVYRIDRKMIRLDCDSPYPDDVLESKINLEARRFMFSTFPGDQLKGEKKLMDAISRPFKVLRGIRPDPDHFTVVRGFATALRDVLHTLRDDSKRLILMPETIAPYIENTVRNSGLPFGKITGTSNRTIANALLKMANHASVRAVILEPRSDFYGATTLAADDRDAVLRLADKFHFPVIEIDYEHEFGPHDYLTLYHTDHKNVVYIGCMSKMTHSLYEEKFVCGPADFITSVRNLEYSCSVSREKEVASISALFEEYQLLKFVPRVPELIKARCLELHACMCETRLAELPSVVAPTGSAILLYFGSETNTSFIQKNLARNNIIIRDAVPLERDGKNYKVLRLSATLLTEQRRMEWIAARICDAWLASLTV